MKIKPWTAFALVGAGLVADFVWAWQVLPSRVVMHWNGEGQADGWGSKGAHLGMMAFAILACTALPTVLALALPRTGTDYINLPHKAYWLAPERREQTLRWMGEQMAWLPVGITAFWGGLLHLTTLANLSQDKTLPATIWILVLMALVVPFVWIHQFAKPFYNTPKQD